jgi:hypothetical protein
LWRHASEEAAGEVGRDVDHFGWQRVDIEVLEHGDTFVVGSCEPMLGARRAEHDNVERSTNPPLWNQGDWRLVCIGRK